MRCVVGQHRDNDNKMSHTLYKIPSELMRDSGFEGTKRCKTVLSILEGDLVAPVARQHILVPVTGSVVFPQTNCCRVGAETACSR